MILKRLYDYAQVAKDKLPPVGLEWKEIEFVIVINREGKFVRFETTRKEKNECDSFLVAKGVQRTSAPKPNILWDNGKYVLGLNELDEKAHNMFVEVIEGIRDRHKDDIAIEAISKFYRESKEQRRAAFEKDPLYPKVIEGLKRNFSFRLQEDTKLIAERKYLFEHLIGDGDEDLPKGRCLVTGEYGPIVRTTTPTPLPDNSPMAALVAFQVRSGYDSYGKSQAFNSPISVKADRAISAVLKLFLGKKSKNKSRIGDRMYLYWGSNDSDLDHRVEKEIKTMLNSYDEDQDNNDEGQYENEDLGSDVFEGIFSGKIHPSEEDRFHILGLAPNMGRIAVVLWKDTTINELAKNMLQHKKDMMLGNPKDPDERKPSFGVYSIVSAVTVGDKLSKGDYKLIEDTVKSIIYGLPYPTPLLARCIERIKAELHEKTVTLQRASILKAIVNRITRSNNKYKQLTPMLDKTNNDIGYLCGRLTAVLEKIQADVKSGDSIRTRYMGAASITPLAVFPTMLRLSGYHIEKMANDKSKVFYARLMDEIGQKIPPQGFPTHFNMQDQGRFFVGYLHQRADFYKKKEE